jgi:hypothetical protein
VEGRWGSSGSELASDVESGLSAPAAGVPEEKVEMVDCLVRAMGADVREEEEMPVVESRKAGTAVGKEFLTYVRTKKNDFRNHCLLFGQISFYVGANVRTLRYSRSVGTYTRDFKF